MPRYHDHNLPDDPHRTAPPYCAPGEIEPPEAPQVSDAEAVARVLAVLRDGEDMAFGDTASQWVEVLAEILYDYIPALVVAILTNSKPEGLRDMRIALTQTITDNANNNLAEMSPEQLENESYA